jgi:membrane protease YdiL (CAAX protease family)
MEENKTKGATFTGLAAYVILAYGITWACSCLATGFLLPFQLPPVVKSIASIVLHYGPTLAAITVVGWIGGTAKIGKLFGKLCLWRVGVPWYLFALLYPPLIKLSAVGLDVLLGATAPAFFHTRLVQQANPAALFLPIFVVVLFQSGIAEEIGWRGFALPQLQQHSSALVSSLILGLLWAGWHFHPQNWESLLPTAGWYILGILSLTVIFTWVFNHTRGSLLIAVLLHTANNTSDWIIPLDPAVTGLGATRAYIIYRIGSLLLAISLVAIWVLPRCMKRGVVHMLASE